MAAIKLPTFAGMMPSIDDHLLADQNASFCENAWLYSGSMYGLPARAELYTLQSPASTTAFRIPFNDGDPSYLYSSTWVEFENADTDFFSAPVAGDTYKRFYWTSTSSIPMYNTLARIIAGQPAWKLGVPQPGNINVTLAGGSSSTLVSRAYVTTLVTEYGEEGPASRPDLVNGKIDATYTVHIAAVGANDLGVERNVKKIRIYRTITSSMGTAAYYMVAEVTALSTAQTYDDILEDVDIAANPILESTIWTAPPDLDGFVVMPNGIIAGFVNNELWFSEAYRPHAWPAVYSITVEFDIVGLAVIGQTLVVCTKGNPITAAGVNPSSITTSKLAAFEPCLTKGSILPTENGVYYASPNGIILVNSGYAQNITSQFISHDTWSEIVDRGRVNAGRFGSAYYAYGAATSAAFQQNAFQSNMVQQEDTGGTSDGFMIDPVNQNMGFTYLADDKDIISIYNDAYSGEMLFVRDGKVCWLDQRKGYKATPFTWRSKIFQPPKIDNFAALKVFFYTDEDYLPSAPQDFSVAQTFDPLTKMGVIRIIADGKTIAAREIRKPGELFRLPSGFKADFWQIEFEGRVRVKSIQMATSVKELSGV